MALEAQIDFERTGKKRRANQRRRLTLRVAGAPSSGEASEVVIRDLSKSGLLLESSVPLSVGDEMIVDLPNTSGAAANVIWASGELYGCQFSQELSDAAVSAALLRSEPNSLISGHPSGERSTSKFGSRLKELRTSKGLTLVELAKRINVSRPTIWSWEAGKSTPRATMMRRILEVLEVTKDEFYGYVDPKQEQEPSLRPTHPNNLQAAVHRAKANIAECAGTTPDKVRLVIEV